MRQYIFLLLFFFLLGALWCESVLIDEINSYRQARGLSLLIGEESLDLTAKEYCSVLLEEGRLRHRDDRGFRVLDRYREKGGTGIRAGEILGASDDLSRLIEAWKESPSHKGVMLNPEWRRIGRAVLEADGQYVAVVLFSNSLIDQYNIREADGGVDLSINSIRDSSISIAGRTSSRAEEINLFLKKEELPILLIISGEKEGRFSTSDFLYLSDIFFNSTH